MNITPITPEVLTQMVAGQLILEMPILVPKTQEVSCMLDVQLQTVADIRGDKGRQEICTQTLVNVCEQQQTLVDIRTMAVGCLQTTYYKQTYLTGERSCRAASRLQIQLTIDDDWRNFQELGRRLIRVRIGIGGREGDVLRGRRDLLHRHLSTFQSGKQFPLQQLLNV